ncbi:restriction endonuclease subunit S [Pseudomonas stutzeri]|uniref:restriction endonuclease subunit S n=1 Tax=Stutzerimonas stutzeri TaxID=316 RepID=UPI00210C49D2|nr:restriction endonuclease subunit S [Stutzerimonas stutzeri]MCQ4228517.1 restriction endonuclease subunit S [Stutzerimonas stutzeri]
MSEWQQGTIGELAKGYRGVTYSAGQLREFKAHDTVTLLRSNNISGGQLNFEDVQIVSEQLVSDDQFLTPGDVAVCMSNGSKALVEKSAQLAVAGDERFTVGAFCSVFRPEPSANSRFVAYVFQSSSYRSNLDLALAGTAINNLRNVDVEAFACDIPPYEEQRKIAQILDTLDTAIRETEALIDKLKAVKQGLLHDLLTRGIDANGQLRPPQSEAPQLYKESPLGWIPREWSYGSLGTWLMGKPKNGYSPQEAGEWTGVQMLGLGCLTKEGFFGAQLKLAPAGDRGLEKALLNDGDLLISRANTRDLVGLVGVYRDIGTPCTYPDLMMRLMPSEETSAEFLQLVLQSSKVRRQIQGSASGTSESMVKISSAIVTGLKVAIPKPDEQSVILCRSKALDAQLQSELQELEVLRAIKAGLMDDLLTGRVRVTPLLKSLQQPPAQTGA